MVKPITPTVLKRCFYPDFLAYEAKRDMLCLGVAGHCFFMVLLLFPRQPVQQMYTLPVRALSVSYLRASLAITPLAERC